MIPNVTTEVAFASTPDDASPTWTDISAYVKRCAPTHGRDNEFREFDPGTNALVLRNDDRRFDPTYAAGPYYGNLHPWRRVRQYVPGPLIGTEFWGDFEAGAAGTAPEWTAMNGLVECKAGAEARQLTYVTTPTPRVGARIARFEVASGDQFGATSGERCEVRRGATNGGFGTGNLEGVTVYYQMSARWLAPWTHPGGEGIFWQMHDAGSVYGQPSFRWRVGTSPITYDFRTVTGTFPNATDAGNGVNAGTSNTHNGRAFAADQWWDFRWAIYYTASTAGWYIAQMKTDAETDWTTVASVGNVSTIQNYPGSSATSQFDKRGWYRPAHASTNVVFGDGYFVGHSWTDVSYSGFSTDSRLHNGWEGREQAATQAGNPSFEVDIVGTSSAGGGTTTRTWDTTRSHTGSGALKMVTNGAASGQGAFHTKRSLNRYDGIVAGDIVTAWTWFSGDGFEQVRIGIEWFDSGGASISTSFAPALALRTDFRRHYITATAPANAVTFRIRTGLSGTNAATFWVDDTDWIMGEFDHYLFDGYIERWDTAWPDRLFQSEVTVQATDGFKLLSAVLQPSSNPAVEGYEEVIGYDQPSLHYRLGEPEGTKLVSHVRRTKHKVSVGGGTAPAYHHITRKWKTRETRAQAEGISGPPGTYKNSPSLGVPGLIASDPDTAVLFTKANTEFANVRLSDGGELTDRNRLTCECWFQVTITDAVTKYLFSGPQTSGAAPTFFMHTFATDLTAEIRKGGGNVVQCIASGAITAGNTYYVAMTWDGDLLRLYLNGVLVDTDNGIAGGKLDSGADDKWFRIGAASDGSLTFDGVLDEVAVFEKALSAERIAAHYEAGLNGYGQSPTGLRVQGVLESTGYDFISMLDSGQRYVLPVRQFGQPSLDLIQEAVAAEGGPAGFFFTAAGVATFLPRNYRDNYPYTTLQASFDEGQVGKIEVEDVAFSHGEDLLYNRVRVQADGGTLQEVSDATTPLGTIYQTFDGGTGVPMVTDADALDEANWILSRTKAGRWRITGVSFPSGTPELPDQMQQALMREVGDMISITRRPGGGTPFTQVSSIERVQHDIDFEANTWKTGYTVSPVADDLSTGWVLGLPGQTELSSTAVLN
jgi:hypothetical protein